MQGLLLGEEVQQCLVEGSRILVTHEVRCSGNDDELAARDVLRHQLTDKREVSRTLFTTYDEGARLQAAAVRTRRTRRRSGHDNVRVDQWQTVGRRRLLLTRVEVLLICDF